jgi:hypothetical protein
MFNICDACGAYRPDKLVEPGAAGALSHATCPECGHRHPFLQAPLLLVTGASGTGKSTVLRRLQGLSQAVLFDSDILWGPHFEKDPHAFFETWLRVCKNTAQAGKPVVLFGAGTGVPANLEACVERRYFSRLHHLALVCEEAALAVRLRARPSWRASGSEEQIQEQLRFNRWFRVEGPARGIALVDTSHEMPNATAERVKDWIVRTLRG